MRNKSLTRRRFRKCKCPTATDSSYASLKAPHMTRFCTGIGSPIGSWILLVGFVPAIAYGAERPDWAFPVTDKIQPPSLANESEPKPPPGSTKSYTRKQIDDLCN